MDAGPTADLATGVGGIIAWFMHGHWLSSQIEAHAFLVDLIVGKIGA